MNLRNLKSKVIRTSLLMTLGLTLSVPLWAKAVEGVININTASATELTLLPGVGQAKAEQIIQMRQTKPFASMDDLKAVKGFGPKRLEALKPHIVFSGTTTAKPIKTAPVANPTGTPAGSAGSSTLNPVSPSAPAINPAP